MNTKNTIVHNTIRDQENLTLQLSFYIFFSPEKCLYSLS